MQFLYPTNPVVAGQGQGSKRPRTVRRLSGSYSQSLSLHKYSLKCWAAMWGSVSGLQHVANFALPFNNVAK